MKGKEIQNLGTREFVRSMHKTAHCRATNGGFEVYYTRDHKKVRLGFHSESRAKAWDEAAKPFYQKMLTKLEI